MESDEDVTLVLHAIWSGTLVVLGGNAPGARKLIEEIQRHRPGG